MISRRHFLRFVAGLGAAGVSTVAYGFGEPALRLGVARYNVLPPQWPAGFRLKIAVIADLHARDPWMSLDPTQATVAHTGERMGAAACRPEGAARRSRHSRQSRLVGRQDRAARRAGDDDFSARAGG